MPTLRSLNVFVRNNLLKYFSSNAIVYQPNQPWQTLPPKMKDWLSLHFSKIKPKPGVAIDVL